jgi:hypothetical protein
LGKWSKINFPIPKSPHLPTTTSISRPLFLLSAQQTPQTFSSLETKRTISGDIHGGRRSLHAHGTHVSKFRPLTAQDASRSTISQRLGP